VLSSRVDFAFVRVFDSSECVVLSGRYSRFLLRQGPVGKLGNVRGGIGHSLAVSFVYEVAPTVGHARELIEETVIQGTSLKDDQNRTNGSRFQLHSTTPEMREQLITMLLDKLPSLTHLEIKPETTT
jgi:hypothetical protein